MIKIKFRNVFYSLFRDKRRLSFWELVDIYYVLDNLKIIGLDITFLRNDEAAFFLWLELHSLKL